MAVENPSTKLQSSTDALPTIVGVMREDDKYTAGSNFAFNGMTDVGIKFNVLKKTMLQML